MNVVATVTGNGARRKNINRCAQQGDDNDGHFMTKHSLYKRVISFFRS